MGGKLDDNGFSLKDRPKVWVVIGEWNKGARPHIIGVFDDEDAAAKEVEDVLTAETPRFRAWSALHFVR
jgi:hypothetical protein